MSQDHNSLPPTRGEGQGQPLDAAASAKRIAHLEAALLHIAETDRHYRRQPKPRADGGLRGWAGHHAVWALTGLNGSCAGDAEVREALGMPEPVDMDAWRWAQQQVERQRKLEAEEHIPSAAIDHPPGGHSHEG